MQQGNKILVVAAMIAGMGYLSGCDNPKERIAMLEEENRSLYLDLEQLRTECDAAKQERDVCRGDLLSAQQINEDLRAQIAGIPDSTMPGEWKAVPGGAMVAIEGSVLFSPGKINLKKNSKTVLGRITSEIKTHFAGKDIYVFGHTDNDPIKKSGWKDNRELSAQRALAVVRFLQSQGTPAKHLVSCGWGEHRPVAPNSSAAGKAKNRRVEIFAVDATLVSAR